MKRQEFHNCGVKDEDMGHWDSSACDVRVRPTHLEMLMLKILPEQVGGPAHDHQSAVVGPVGQLTKVLGPSSDQTNQTTVRASLPESHAPD
jgi:hypothetical protein